MSAAPTRPSSLRPEVSPSSERQLSPSLDPSRAVASLLVAWSGEPRPSAPTSEAAVLVRPSPPPLPAFEPSTSSSSSDPSLVRLPMRITASSLPSPSTSERLSFAIALLGQLDGRPLRPLFYLEPRTILDLVLAVPFVRGWIGSRRRFHAPWSASNARSGSLSVSFSFQLCLTHLERCLPGSRYPSTSPSGVARPRATTLDSQRSVRSHQSLEAITHATTDFLCRFSLIPWPRPTSRHPTDRRRRPRSPPLPAPRSFNGTTSFVFLWNCKLSSSPSVIRLPCARSRWSPSPSWSSPARTSTIIRRSRALRASRPCSALL